MSSLGDEELKGFHTGADWALVVLHSSIGIYMKSSYFMENVLLNTLS